MDTLYNIVQHAHSGLRWVVLVLLVAAIVQGFAKRREGVPYPAKNKLALYAFISTHIQLLLGLALWLWLSPYALGYEGGDIMSNRIVRFYTVEHFTGMILAIGLITFGYIRAKRQGELNKGWKTVAIFYSIGLLIILASIPWPGRDLQGGWF